jgi:diguanylate cyclase (GGDEF)-like protein
MLLEDRISKIRADFLIRVTTILSVLALVGLPCSLFHALEFGWLPIQYLHVGTSVWILMTYAYRHRLSSNFLYISGVTNLLLVGLTSFIELGVFGIGYYCTFAAVLIITIMRGVKKGLISTVVLSVVLGGIGSAWSMGHFTFPYDYSIYVQSFNGWIPQFVVFFVIVGLMAVSVSTYVSGFKKLVNDVNQQKKDHEYLANHDALTGLPTLRLAMDRLNIAISLARREQRKVAALYLDLDGFKLINDTHGHDAGDQILQSISLRIQETMRTSDTACRIGGDEFLIILNNVDDYPSVDATCQRLIAAIGERIEYQGNTLQVGVSIGGAIFPDHAHDAKSLRHAADKEMYSVKKEGKNNFKIARQNAA